MKYWTWWVGVALIAAGLLQGCGGSAAPSPGADARQDQGSRQIEIALVPMGLSHQFWLTMKEGADAAARETGVSLLWQGPAKESEFDKQINIVQDLIVRKVSAILLAACDENALVDAVNQADRAGIPVICVDSGVASDTPKSLIATDNVLGAKKGAEELARLIGEEGEVGLVSVAKGIGTSELREKGFFEGIEQFPRIRVVSVQYSQADMGTAMNVTQDMLTGNPGIKGIFAANEAGTVGAAQALRALGKAGTVKLVGFDASEHEIEALREDVVQALVVQNPYRMGYEGVMTALKVLRGETVPKRIDTGVTVVRKADLDNPDIRKLLRIQ